MPVQSNDTRNDAMRTNPDVFGDKRQKQRSNETDDNGLENEPNQANYGFGSEAEFDSEAEETEDQEYMAGGMQETSKYMKDSDVRGEKADQTPKDTEWKHGRGKSGCGC